MNLDKITDVEWFRKELKKYCVYIKKDINEYFVAGNWYPIEENEGGMVFRTWDNEHYMDIFSLPCDMQDIDKYVGVNK